jgi:uncharacterized protein YbjQ (UPF0145 family)
MSEIISCPACGAKLKSGVFSQNRLLSNESIELIAEMNNVSPKQGCEKCSGEQHMNALGKFRTMRSEIRSNIMIEINNVPIITAHSPYNWDYQILGIATGQSTTGTGLFSEVASSWTDFLGMQSEAYNNKIAQGEYLCAKQVRSKAIQMGGNAVIALDIDYAELGGGKGMIMVCMSGTVIRLNNMDVLDKYKVESIKKISDLTEKLYTWENKYPLTIKESK